MENRLCSTGYPTWQIRYYYSNLTSYSGTLTYYFRNEIKIYESDKILFKPGSSANTLSMELYEPHELLPVDGKYTFSGGKRYLFQNVRSSTTGSYYNWYFYCSYLTKATVSNNSITMTGGHWSRYNGSLRSVSAGSTQDPFDSYTIMDESSQYFGYLAVATYTGGGTILTNKEIAGGVSYNQNISSADTLIGGIACAEIKFTTLTPYSADKWYYEVKYNDTDEWIKMGTFYLIERERQDTGVWNYVYRDAASVVDNNANRYLKLLYEGTDDYYHWNRYTLTKTSVSGSITVNPNSGVVIAEASLDSQIPSQLTVDENNVIKFTKPINSVFRQSKFTLLRYTGQKQEIQIEYPTYLVVSNSLDIEKGKQGTVALSSTAKREYVSGDGDISGRYIEYEGTIYYVWKSTSTSETNVCPVVYSSYQTITGYDVPETFNQIVVGDYTATSLAMDYYEPIDICKLCYYTHPYLVSINDNVYYSNSRSVSNDVLTINYSRQYTLSAPSDIRSSAVNTYPDYGWGSNYYYIRTKLPNITTARGLWDSVCKYIGLSVSGTWADSIPFMSHVLKGVYNTEQLITYRTILSNIVQMCNGYGYVNSNGNFVIGSYNETSVQLDETYYSNLTVKNNPVDVYNYFQVNLENQEDYMHYGMGSKVFYINNILCTTSDKYAFLAQYFPVIAELFEDLGNWYKTEITLNRDYGIKPGDVITVKNSYGHPTPIESEYKTIVLSKTISAKGVVLSSLTV